MSPDYGWSLIRSLFLHRDTQANDSHIPGGAGIYQVVLGSQAVPSDLEIKVCIEDLTINVDELARVWTEGLNTGLAEGQKF